jgi:tRNA A37 methylthiotransferase MiaB
MYIDAFKETKINSINLTIQSGSNEIIRRMNRTYDVSEILAIMKILKRISPATVFWTHVIVGFPGETLGDFVKTLSIMGHFEAVGVYCYSDREGTSCAAFENKNSPFVKYLKYVIASSVAKINSSVKIMGELIKPS